MFDTAVAFLIFNRPDYTAKVFERIRAAQPRRLFVVADGPRPGVADDAANCAAARAMSEHVDWDCEVFRNYAPTNMGCGRRVASGLDWVFDHVGEAIVLEDDCLPDPSFFRFCAELLARYSNDPSVAYISGTNILGTWRAGRQSYFRSWFGTIWGWATWKRAWSLYDYRMEAWLDDRAREEVRRLLAQPRDWQARIAAHEAVLNGSLDTWDYQWDFGRWRARGMVISPAVNLVTNLGLWPDSRATHTGPGSSRLI
jgi:hypothetical protein